MAAAPADEDALLDVTIAHRAAPLAAIGDQPENAQNNVNDRPKNDYQHYCNASAHIAGISGNLRQKAIRSLLCCR
jgi:hypothetical protein